AAPSMVLGQAIGRWGNFFNEEAFGRPTDLPWKLYISPEHRPLGYAQFEYFHPTFLYESIWDFAVFLLLVGVLRSRLRHRPGALFFAYVGLYSIGRFAIEALRLDSFWLGPVRVPQLARDPAGHREGRDGDARHPPGLRAAGGRCRRDRRSPRRREPGRDRLRHQLRRATARDRAPLRRHRRPHGSARRRALRGDSDRGGLTRRAHARSEGSRP